MYRDDIASIFREAVAELTASRGTLNPSCAHPASTSMVAGRCTLCSRRTYLPEELNAEAEEARHRMIVGQQAQRHPRVQIGGQRSPWSIERQMFVDHELLNDNNGTCHSRPRLDTNGNSGERNG